MRRTLNRLEMKCSEKSPHKYLCGLFISLHSSTFDSRFSFDFEETHQADSTTVGHLYKLVT